VALVGHLEGAGPWNLVEEVELLLFVGDQVTVEVVVQVRLRDLVSQGNCIWDDLRDLIGYFAVVFVVFGFDVTSIPSVIVAVGALLDHKD